MNNKPLLIEIVAYAPTAFYHCTHCEVVWKESGFSTGLHEEQIKNSLPADMLEDYQKLSEWIHHLVTDYCDQVIIKVIDAVSLEGMQKSIWHRLGRYPAVIVGGRRRFVGNEFSIAEAEIARHVASAT